MRQHGGATSPTRGFFYLFVNLLRFVLEPLNRSSRKAPTGGFEDGVSKEACVPELMRLTKQNGSIRLYDAGPYNPKGPDTGRIL